MNSLPRFRFARTFLPFALAAGLPLAALAAPVPLKVGASFQEINNPYFVTMKGALEEATASLGATLLVTDARHDVSKQLSDIEDML